MKKNTSKETFLSSRIYEFSNKQEKINTAAHVLSIAASSFFLVTFFFAQNFFLFVY